MGLDVERLRAIYELHGCKFNGQSLEIHFGPCDAKKNNPAGASSVPVRACIGVRR